MAGLYYENISFSPILGLLGPELPGWANGGLILVFIWCLNLFHWFLLRKTDLTITYMPILSNMLFWLVLGLPNGPPGESLLCKWANRGQILVFMILGHFSFIPSQENGSNGMLQASITKNVANGPLGVGDCCKRITLHLCGKKWFFDSTIGVLFRKTKNSIWTPCPDQSVWLPD